MNTQIESQVVFGADIGQEHRLDHDAEPVKHILAREDIGALIGDGAASGPPGLGHHLHQRGLAGTVPADQSHDLASADGEADVIERTGGIARILFG